MSLIADVLAEQIAGLQASAAMFVQQRADALAAAAAAAVQSAGATARAAELQAALDTYQALIGAPDPELTPEPTPEPAP
jgi:hypothetical protein